MLRQILPCSSTLLMISIRLLLIFCVWGTLNAQTILGLRVGIAKQHSVGQSNPDPSTWHNGASIGLHIDHHIWNALSVSVSAAYSFYRFDKYVYRGATIPEIRIVGSHGENSQILRIGLDAKLTTLGPEVFRIQFVTGGAVIKENLGNVSMTFENMDSGTYDIMYPNKSKFYLAHSVGLGFQSFFSKRIGIEVMAQYYSDYSERLDSSIDAGLVYRFW